MKLRNIIETIPGNVKIEVREMREKILFNGLSENWSYTMSDEDMSRNVFTFFPATEINGAEYLIIYLAEEDV